MEYCEINDLVKRADSIKHSNITFFKVKCYCQYFDLKNVAFSKQPL